MSDELALLDATAQAELVRQRKASPRDRVAVSASANRVPHHPPAPPALCGASAVRLTRHMTFDGQQQHPLEGTHVLVTRDDDLVGARGVRLQKESEL